MSAARARQELRRELRPFSDRSHGAAGRQWLPVALRSPTRVRPGHARGSSSLIPLPTFATPILVTGPPRWDDVGGADAALSPSVGYLHEPFSIATSKGISSAPFPRMFEFVDEHNEALYAPGLERTMSFDYALGPQLRTLRTPRDLARTFRDRAAFRALHDGARRPLLKDPIAVFSAEWLARRYGSAVVLTIRHPRLLPEASSVSAGSHASSSFSSSLDCSKRCWLPSRMRSPCTHEAVNLRSSKEPFSGA